MKALRYRQIDQKHCRLISLVIVLLYLLQSPASAQFPFFIHYSADNGLPATEILDIRQDGKGYIWFASAYGLSRFNGSDFKEFTLTDGLPSLSYTKTFSGTNGQVWFASYEARICYTARGDVNSFAYNPAFSKALKHTPVLNMVWLKDGSILAKSSKNPVIMRILPNGMISPFGNNFFPKGSDADIFIIPYEKELIWGLRADSAGNIPERQADLKELGINNSDIHLFKLEKDFQVFLPSTKADYTLNLHYCFIEKGRWYIAFDRKLFLFSNGKLSALSTFPDVINCMFIDRENNLWVSVANQGAWKFDNKQIQKGAVKYLLSKNVSGILQDHQGGYWFSTLEDGVYYVPGFSFTTYTQNGGLFVEPVQSLAVAGDRIIVSTSDRHTFLFTPAYGGEVPAGSMTLTGISELVSDIACIDRHIWLLGSRELRYTAMLEPAKLSDRHAAYAYSINSGRDGDIWVVCDKAVYLYKNNRLDDFRWEFPPGAHPRVCGSDSSGQLWIGSFQGLFKAGKSIESQAYLHPVLASRISAIASTKDKLWIGSRTSGILLIQGDKLTHFTVEKGLLSNSINALLPQGEQVLWVGTNKGLSRVLLQGNGQDKPVISSFSIWEGLPAGEIRKIVKLNDRIWLGTNRGLVSFNPDTIAWQIPKAPGLILEKILLNDSKPVPDTFTKFEPWQNTLTFFFQGISFVHPAKVIYRYKLEGADTNWIITSNRSVRFPKLNAGQYNFIVQASVHGSPWSDPPVAFSFILRKPFSATIAFLGLMIFSGLLLISLVFFIVLRNQKRRAATRRAVLLSEIKALRSQMNPHFIFNSLNSIQYFILEKSQENANIYLSSFSQLMRRILEQSRHNLITVKDELETIRIYLDLEKLRFEKAFIYEEVIDPEVDPEEIRIPPMLIQPFLENSIWHGLMPKKEQGNLKLMFSIDPQGYLLISIKDNGVGRSSGFDPHNRHPGHQPTGMKNIEERILLFNQINQSNLTVEVIDLYDNDGKPAGTLVRLKLPLNLVA